MIDVNGFLDFFSEDEDFISSVEIPTFYVDGCVKGLFQGESLEVYKSLLKNSGSKDLEKISEIQVGKKEEKTPSVEISLVPSQKPTSKPTKVPASEPTTQKLTPEPSKKTTNKPNKAPANESTTPQPTPEETADPRLKTVAFSQFSMALSLESYEPVGLLESMLIQTRSYMTKSIKDKCFQNKKYSFKQMDLILQYSEQTSQEAIIEVSGFLDFFSEDEDFISSVEIPTFYVDDCIKGLFKGKSLEAYKSILKNSGRKDLEKISDVRVGTTSIKTKKPKNSANMPTPKPSKSSKNPSKQSSKFKSPEPTETPTTEVPTGLRVRFDEIKSIPFSEFEISLSLESYNPITLLESMLSLTRFYITKNIKDSCFQNKLYRFKQVNLIMFYSQRNTQDVTIAISGFLEFNFTNTTTDNSKEITSDDINGCIQDLFEGESLEVYQSFLKNSDNVDLQKISKIQKN